MSKRRGHGRATISYLPPRMSRILRGQCGAAPILATCPAARNNMAKGQQRSGREKKKPKKDKRVIAPVSSPFDRATPLPQKK